MRTRGRFAVALKRLRASALPIVQCGLAAGLAWLVASDVFGHERPFFAPIAAVISLGVSLANRLRRAVELIVGVSLGVLVGDLIVSVIGSGWWQIALVVTLAVAAAVFADGGTLLVNQAGASAVLIATLLPPGQVGGLDRCVDALIGGVLGVLVAAVIPSDPVAPVRRTSRALLDELAAVLRGTADALRDRDADAALAALQRARRTQPLIDSLRGALHGGREVTTVSPLHRRRRRVLAATATSPSAPTTPCATPASSPVAPTRRCSTASRRFRTCRTSSPNWPAPSTGSPPSSTGKAISRAPVRRWSTSSRTPRSCPPTRRRCSGTPSRCSSLQIRSIALDLLQATGLSHAEARTAMS